MIDLLSDDVHGLNDTADNQKSSPTMNLKGPRCTVVNVQQQSAKCRTWECASEIFYHNKFHGTNDHDDDLIVLVVVESYKHCRRSTTISTSTSKGIASATTAAAEDDARKMS